MLLSIAYLRYGHGQIIDTSLHIGAIASIILDWSILLAQIHAMMRSTRQFHLHWLSYIA
jgi:hypothetical protein